jgi:hypothetical protein
MSTSMGEIYFQVSVNRGVKLVINPFGKSLEIGFVENSEHKIAFDFAFGPLFEPSVNLVTFIFTRVCHILGGKGKNEGLTAKISASDEDCF